MDDLATFQAEFSFQFSARADAKSGLLRTTEKGVSS